MGGANLNADTFTVSSNTNYRNTTTNTSGTYQNDWFRPGKGSSYAGSAGFFESQGSTESLNIVTGKDGNTKYGASKTNLGAADDATNLQNMKKSIEIVKETNRLRALNGLAALKITDRLMAMSQIQTNWSRYQVQHSQMYNVGENLAWSYGITGGNYSAFGGWYDEELAIFNRTKTCDSSTGHYCNIVDGKSGVQNMGYTITGAAVGDSFTGYGDETYGQTFSQTGWNPNDKTYTPDEYLALLDAYIASGGWSYMSLDNVVDVTSSVAISKVSGGYATSGHARRNTVNLNGTGVIGEVHGGYAINGNVDGNTVNFNSGKVSGTIWGGYTEQGQNYWRTYHDNTLNIITKSQTLEAGNIANFQNINFYLPSVVWNGYTALRLTGQAQTNLSKTTVSAHLSNASGLTKDSIIHLISTNGTLTKPQSTNTNNVVNINIADLVDVKGQINLSSDNKHLNLSFTGTSTGGGNNPNPNPNPNPGGGNLGTTTDLIGTGKAKENTKSFLETNMAGQSIVSQNSDLFNANLVQIPLSRGASSYAFAQGYDSRLKSGSHVDAKGFNLNAGISSTTYFRALALTGGAFFEYGAGKYDSYLDNGTHGEGDTKTYGGGLFAKITTNSDNYGSLALRAGLIESDYQGSIPTNYGFESKQNYYGFDVTLGSIFKPFKSNELDIYGTYSFALTKGDEVDLGVGATLKIDDITSHRIKVGLKDSFYLNKSNSLYIGAGYGYEFDSESNGQIVVIGNAYDVSSPKLKGSNVIGDLGYAYEVKRFKFDIGVSGSKGKNEGISGKLGFLFKI